MDVELCVGSFEEALLADQLNFKRVELCCALEIGGLTPSLGLIQKTVQSIKAEVHVMIRPRGGDFCYSEDEFGIITKDIELSAEAGATGVVFGVLDTDSNIDIYSTRRLIEKAKSHDLEVTFHRAFDFVNDTSSSLKTLIELNADRILTSGKAPTALEGIKTIASLAEQANGRIQIMAGSGINATNILQIAETGVDAIHFTAHRKIPAGNDLGMGHCYEPDIEKAEMIMSKLYSL